MPLFEWPALGWLALAIVAAIVEVSIPHFGLVFVSVGAVAAALAAAFFGFGCPAQIVVFVVVADRVARRCCGRGCVASLGGRGVPSRTEPLIGRDGVVTHDIDPTLGTGRVNVGGEDWAARSAEPIAAGHAGPRRRRRRHRAGGHARMSGIVLLGIALVPAGRPDADDQDRPAEAGEDHRAARQVPPHRRSRPQHHRAVPRLGPRDASICASRSRRSSRSRSSRATT